jgi:biopolymer transport protein ExbD
VLVKSISRKRRRPSQFLNGIDLWSLLSVQLVLLIVFMTAPNRPHHHPWAMDLPRMDHASPMPAALREDAVMVTLTRDGMIFFGPTQVRGNDLPASIQDYVRRGSEPKVYLRVDARAKYGDAAIVIDEVRQAGIQEIGIITEQRQPSRP